MKSLSHLPKLDGLRGLAIIGVLIEHFFPVAAIRDMSPGGAGVTLFFVLSGYLITRIILNYKTGAVSVYESACHFYIRRLLRLSPPYYVMILIAALLNLNGLEKHWWIPALYLTNFQIAYYGYWQGEADHFWSLSVEEQFYLFWFFIVMVIPIRYFVSVIIAAFVVTFIFRFYVYTAHMSSLVTVLLPGHLVSLLTGALIAYSTRLRQVKVVEMTFSNGYIMAAGGVIFLSASILLTQSLSIRLFVYPFISSLFFGCLIYRCANNIGSSLEWLTWKPLQYIGKVSYGIFVYHMFIPEKYVKEIVGGNSWLTFFAMCCISIIIAMISWSFMEKRILQYKELIELRSANNKKVLEKIGNVSWLCLIKAVKSIVRPPGNSYLGRHLKEISILQTVRYNSRSDSTITLYIHKNVSAKIKSTAKLVGSGVLDVGAKWPAYDFLPSVFSVWDDASLEVEGNFTIHTGCKVVVDIGARLTFGSGYISTNSVIACFREIRIGHDVAIADNVVIRDSDNHTVSYGNNPPTQPIVIGDHVWIGMNTIVLKGVTIGNGAVIGAGSLVNWDIPPRALAAGVPARVLRENVEWK